MWMRWLALCLLMILVAEAGTSAGEAKEEGWQLLFANQPAEAAKRFAAPGGDDPVHMLAALEGRYACARMQADFETAWKVALEQAWLSASMPDGMGTLFFQRLDRLAAGLRRQTEFLECAQGLLPEEKTHPAVRRLAQDAVHRGLMLRREHDKAKALEAKDGYVRLFAGVIGPFRNPAGLVLDKDEGPEQRPGQAEYTDALGRPVKRVANVKADRFGALDLDDVIPATVYRGSAYALALVQSEKAQTAVLSVRGPQALKMWLRGALVFRGDHYRFAYNKSTREVQVRLQAGVNPLLLKCSKDASVALRFLSVDGGVAGGLTWGEYDAKALPPCALVRGYVQSAPAPAPIRATVEKLDAPLPAKLLWLAGAYEAEAKIQEARQVWDAFVKGHPKSVYLLTQAAQARLRESRFGVDAASRLTEEAMDLLAEAQKIAPENYAVLMLLGRHHVHHKQKEQALPLFRKAVELYPAASSARYALARLYQSKGWKELAEAEFKKLVDLSVEWDLMLARFYDDTGRQEAGRAIRDKAWNERRLSELGRYQMLKDLGLWAEARRVLEERAQAYPTQQRSHRRRLLTLALASNDWEQAEAILRQELEAQPESPQPAVRLGELFLRQNKPEQAREWFAQADARGAANEAVDANLRRRLRKLTDKPWPLLKHDIALKDVPHQTVKKEDHPRANYAVVLRTKIHRIHEDRSAESLIHNAIKVFDKEGVDALSEMSVPTEADALLYCRTVQPDGSVFVPASAENLQLGKATSMYNVRPGSVLEYAYREVTPGGRSASFADRFAVEEMNVPVIRSRYVLVLPQALVPELSIKVHPDDLKPTVEHQGDTVILRWDFENRPGLKPEYFLPADEETLANIQVEVLGADYGDQRWRLQPARPLRSNEAIAKQALEIVGKTDDDAARVRLVHSWIATTIKDAPGAQTARDAFALRSGDVSAKTQLCQAMLAALGIDAYRAWAHTRFGRAGVGSRKQRASTVDRFNHALLHVRLPEREDMWLTFHRPARNFGLHALGFRLIGAPALEVNDGGVELVAVRGELDETQRDEEIVVALQEDGAAAVRAVLTYYGSWAGHMRTTAEQPQRGPLQMERLAAEFFPKITLDESDYPDGSDKREHPLPDKAPFIFRFRGRVKQFCRHEGERLAFDPFLGRSLGAKRFLTPLPRVHPFEIRRDHVVGQRFVFHAPDGWAFAEVPADRCWATAFGFYVLDFTVEGRTLTASRLLILPTQLLKPNEYEALHAWLGAVEKTERLSVTLSPLPKGEAVTDVYDGGAVEILDLNTFRPRYWPASMPRLDGK